MGGAAGLAAVAGASLGVGGSADPASAQPTNPSITDWINVVTDVPNGAKNDGVTLTDAVMNLGTKTLTSASASFTSADVGKSIGVAGAGPNGINLNTTIAGFTNSTTITLTTAAGHGVSSATATYGTDNTGAFKAAIALLPATGGVVYIPAGTYLIAQGGQVIASNATGTPPSPIYLRGAGRQATQINFSDSTGACFRMYNNYVPSGGPTSIEVWGGGVEDLTIDGSTSGNGSVGLHIGDMKRAHVDITVQNFASSNAVGIHLDNTLWWTENGSFDLELINCTSGVVFDVSNTGSTEFDNNRFHFGLDLESGQNGVILENGAYIYHADIFIHGGIRTSNTGGAAFSFNATDGAFTAAGSAFVNGTAVALTGSSLPAPFVTGKVYYVTGASGTSFSLATTPGGQAVSSSSSGPGSVAALGAALTVVGQGGSNNINSFIEKSHLSIMLESGGPNTFTPQTILQGTQGNRINECYGIMSFRLGPWALSNIIPAQLANQFTYFGVVDGDINLNPAGNNGLAAISPVIYGQGNLAGDTGIYDAQQGDFFAVTLSGTITLTPNDSGSESGSFAGPQRKTFIITQATSGGPFNVNWPSRMQPSQAHPTVVWLSGVTPVMPTAAGAVMVIELTSLDGATWYGSQPGAAVSGQYLCPPTSYAPAAVDPLPVPSTSYMAVSSANINTGNFFAPPSGSVVVTASFAAQLSAAANMMGFTLVTHGKSTVVCDAIQVDAQVANSQAIYTLEFIVTSLTPGAQYNFDLAAAASLNETVTIHAYGNPTTTATSSRGAPATMTVRAV
jgi:hypothetical protein